MLVLYRVSFEGLLHMRKTSDQILDGKHSRRLKMEDRFLARRERQYEEAKRHVGILNDGTCYCFADYSKPEFKGTFVDCAEYLIKKGVL